MNKDGCWLRFMTTSSPVSSLIRFFTWSNYSHVEFVLKDGRLLGSHLDGGVQARDPNYSTNITDVAYGYVDCPIEVTEKVLRFAYKQIGKPYDLPALFGLVGRRDWKRDNSWFCSELIAEAFDKAGYPLIMREPTNRITPANIYMSPLVEICQNKSS
jgi:uncharacterized protein YycO